MHIPDGYISPIMTIGSALITVPVWSMAATRVKAILNNRTIPLLAVFSALSFTIMMFNVPVPGGTTAHGVGGTLTAIVLGPWAAVLTVSVALIIQALFFGDGGILAIFLNCLTMGIVLPFVGYATYRLVAARAPLLSPRRAWAGGIGGYVGITAAALLVGVLLGLQPVLFSDASGKPLYSPYGLEAAVPAMLLAHIFGASIVEAIITGLGVAYLQKRHPELLESLKGVFAGESVEEGVASRRPLWQIVTATVVGGVVVLGVVGLVLGGGDPTHFFGGDWSSVSGPDVLAMLVFTAVMALILIPIAYFVLPSRWKRIGAAFTALAVLAPLGLIAPGFAYGEGSTEDVQAAFGYVPQGLQDLSNIFSAPLAGYDIPIAQSDSLIRAAIGYQIAGMIGILLCGVAAIGIAELIRRVAPDRTPTPEST
jgi:cobalt/nickel transport system permease protein